MKINNIGRTLLVAAMLAIAFAGFATTAAYATHFTSCVTVLGGVLDQTGNPDTCTLTCPDGSLIVGSTFKVNNVTVEDWNMPACPSPRVPVETGRCRLISVDKPIHVATTFQAEWRGPLISLRLREPGASILFLSPVPGSVQWTSNNSKVGTFATLGVVDVGNYFASCMSDIGMVGAEIKTEVRR